MLPDSSQWGLKSLSPPASSLPAEKKKDKEKSKAADEEEAGEGWETVKPRKAKSRPGPSDQGSIGAQERRLKFLKPVPGSKEVFNFPDVQVLHQIKHGQIVAEYCKDAQGAPVGLKEVSDKVPRYQRPAAGIDLRKGFSPSFKGDNVLGDLDVVKHCVGDKMNHPTVLSHRHNLTKIAIAQFPISKSMDPWRIGVECKEGGTVELVCMRHEKWKPFGRLEPHRQRPSYYGRRFEVEATVHESGRVPDAGTVPEYCRVIELELGEHRIVMAAQIDCRDRDGMVELKTARVGRPKTEKAIDWWMQAKLADVPKVITGYHDDGFLRNVEEFKTDEMPKKFGFDPNVPIGFLDAVLTWIKQHVEVGRMYWLLFEPPFTKFDLVEVK